MQKAQSLSAVVFALALGLSACASQSHKASPKAQASRTPAAAPAAASTQTAASAAPGAAAAAAPVGKKHKLWGIVVSFDASTGKLVLKDRHGHKHDLDVWAGAKYTKGGAHLAIAANDVHAGDLLTVWHVGETAVGVHLNIKPASSPADTAVAKH